MALVVAACQQTTMHLGVKGLNTAIANLGEARNIADADGLYAAILEEFLCASRSDNLPAKAAQVLTELHNATLVANTN